MRQCLLVASILALSSCSEPSTDDDGVPTDGGPASDAPADPPPPIDLSRCPGGEAPDLESCTAGVFHADCGGTGDPALACSTQNCKWFAGGCPATNYRPIDCPLGDPFCVPTDDGLWPYASGSFDITFPSNMCDQVDLIGDAIVTATSGPTLDVRIDPTVTGSENITLDCDRVELELCRRIERGSSFHPGVIDSETFFFRGGSTQGDTLVLEVDRRPDGTRFAKAHVLQYTDYWSQGEDCVRYVTEFSSFTSARPIITSGELLLSAEPDGTTGVRGQATMHTADGGTMILLF